jgi:hypothetical protein
MSKNFNITITEVLKTTVEVVDAENLEEAIQTVKDQYHDQEITLTADDFTGQVTFEEEKQTEKENTMLTLTFKNNDVLTIPESAIADFRALGITNALRFKHGHWVPDSIAKAVSMNLYVDRLKQLKTVVNETAPASNKTALDNLLDGNYQITSFAHDKDQPIYVTWQTTDNDENINKNQSITKGKTPNGEVLQITIVNENT